MKRNVPLRRKTPLKRKTRLSTVSPEHKRELLVYYPVRNAYLQDHPFCEICGKRAWDVHHRAGRKGPFLIDTRWFLAICRACHTEIHDNQRWAREKGYLVERCVALAMAQADPLFSDTYM